MSSTTLEPQFEPVEKEAPRAAFRLDAGPVQFQQGDDLNEREADVNLLARSGDPVVHWWWGKVVHDLAGMIVGPKVPFDYCHYRDEIVGFGDEFDTAGGDLAVGGKLVTFLEGDRAAEIISKGRRGVPYQASIEFDPYNQLRIEEIGPDDQAEVNGRTVTGPCTIFRQWMLRAVAICPVSADPQTQTELAQQEAQTLTVTVNVRKGTMSDQPNNPTDDQATAPEAPETQQAQPTGDAQQQPAAATEQLSVDELDRYVKEFGADNGVKWLREGKTFEQALQLQNTQLRQDLDSANQNAETAQTQLAAIDTGEESTALASTPGQQTPEQQGQAKKTGLAQFIRINRATPAA